MIRVKFIVVLIFCAAVSLCQSQTLQRYDVIIDEIFPDPSPSVGLPNAEFLELRNISEKEINLRNWKIGRNGTTATIRADFILKPDSFLILCSNTSQPLYSRFGPCVGVTGFPALANDGDSIRIISAGGMVVHAIAYDRSWYHNELKAQGGWSLEMIDVKNYCSGASNWSASENILGGSPGTINSLNAENPDEDPPALLRTYTKDGSTIIAVFSEPLDSLNASEQAHFSIDNGIGQPLNSMPLAPLFNEVALQFEAPLLPETVYRLTVNEVKDCKGNVIALRNIAKAGVPAPAKANDLLINEILFDPPPLGSDYIEYYNASRNILDMNHCYMATRKPNNDLHSIYPLAKSPYLLFPGEFAVFTENRNWVLQQYQVKDPDQLFELNSLPSLPNKEGTHVLLNGEGSVIDEVHYSNKWHFALIANKEGVALERMSYSKPTQMAENWTSASSLSGYGSPTAPNSQSISSTPSASGFAIKSKTFSPDNDGFEDFCLIEYSLDNPGYVASIQIFDAQGKIVRRLINNLTLGISGSIRWDGMDDSNKLLPAGAYIVMGDIFSLQGDRKIWKEVVFLMKKN